LLYGYAGISVGDAKYCSISGNRIAGNQHGITLVSSSYCNITRNYFELIGLSSAVQLSYSTNNLVAGNYIDSCTEGIQLRENSENNVVSENTIINCDDVAIRLLYSDRNTISTNNISDSGVGTSIYVSNENDISNNCYLNNTIQISANEWYAQQWGYGYSNNTITLNYWSDYNGIDSNGDGIGDTPYIIDENNQDNSPLMEPEDIEVILEFPSWTPLLIMLVAIAAVALIYRRRLAEKQRRADK
jgi:parallel beta-helix repeat protein